MRDADKERFDALLTWATSHGASVHSAVEIYKDDVTGFSMRVKPHLGPEERRLEPQDEVLTCPLATSLSYVNALHGGPLLPNSDAGKAAEKKPPAFPPAFMALPPHVVGRFYLVQQYLLGPSSFWHPYVATLPQPDVLSSWSLPSFWPEDDAALLEGTNAGIAARAVRDQLRREHKEARRILRDAGVPGWQDYTRALHDWAYAVFASRSFRPSLVFPNPGGDAAPLLLLPERGVAIDDFSVLLPVFDIVNHSMRAQVRWLPAAGGDGGGNDDLVGRTCCRFQTFDAYGPGEQVFNSYGKKTNSELLLSYGFVVPESDDLHNDYFHVRKKQVGAGGGATHHHHQHQQQQQPSPQQQQEMSTGAAGGSAAGAPPPQDFVVSLRPMHHPSSHVGRARQRAARDPAFDLRPEFAHVEDALVWDLCLMVVGGGEGEGEGEGNRASLVDSVLARGPSPREAGCSEAAAGGGGGVRMSTEGGCEEELECMRRILSASAALPGEVCRVVEQVKLLLLAKLGMEYDKLCETDPGVGVDEDGDEVVEAVVPQNRNQELALQYRAQLKKVLEVAISALVPGWQDEDGSEEST